MSRLDSWPTHAPATHRRARQPSHLDPIRVDFLPVDTPGFAGRLGLTIAPGNVDHPRGWDHDLAVDLAALAGEHRTTLLVSLTEAHEYELLQIPTLLADARSRAMACAWFLIRDVAAPRAEEMPAFSEPIDRMATELGRGGDRGEVACHASSARLIHYDVHYTVGLDHEKPGYLTEAVGLHNTPQKVERPRHRRSL